ncbi:MAG: hypothetical protein EOO88_53640 [Pedobacter sp.]|nr:MAG: hypothetical protein EOO88_53640 [Pedobacter sp.]
MLTNKITFARLMALLRSIDPSVPLPDELEPYLWKHMFDHGLCKKAKRLEEWGETPKNSYYVVTGIVIVFCFDKIGDRHTFRIYGANSIVAMECFMKHEKSEFMIWQCRGSVVLSISYGHMQEIYKMMDGMDRMGKQSDLQIINGNIDQDFA